ncbi:MAG: efflux transporter outer membrane subunit [Bryobacterales bacterium]|nr:efflux transporter outer membrane subunit [Bryobacterales bacterium]
MNRAALLTLPVILVAAGCRVRQPYATPPSPVPPAFTEQPPTSVRGSKAWQAANPADGFHRGEWWTIFGDPVLNELEQRVNDANQDLKSAVERFRQARAFVKQNRSERYPAVTAGAAIAREHYSTNRPLAAQGPSGYNDFSLPVDVSWEPDLWGRIRNLVEASAESAQATAADVESVRLSIHAELASDYFALRSFDQERRILNAAVVNFEKAVALTRNRFEGGVANRVDLEEAQTQLEATRAQAIDLTEIRQKLEHAIAVLTGRPPEGFTLAEQAVLPVLPAIPVGIPSALLERRPDIAAAERRVAAANTQIGLARTAFYPRVLLGAAFGLESKSITDWLTWPSRFWAIGPSALQTVFDAGRRRAVLEQSMANYDALVAAYRETVLTAFQQVEDNLASLRVLENELDRQRLAVSAARRSEDLSMNRYRGGLVTYLEVATAQTIRLQNERVAVDLDRRRMESSVLLIKSLGGGWDRNTLPSTADLMAGK